MQLMLFPLVQTSPENSICLYTLLRSKKHSQGKNTTYHAVDVYPSLCEDLRGELSYFKGP